MSDFWNGKRVAVLGGAGMVGTFLTKMLIEAGAEVIVVDDLSRGRLSNLKGLSCRFTFADLTNIHNLRPIKGQDAVFNLAARVTGMHYNRLHHDEMFRHNILLQTIPLNACIMWEVPLYLQCSTVCVYPRDMEFPASEGEGYRGQPEPTSAGYAWAKRMGELYAEWVQDARPKMGIAIPRFSNCFGPGDYFDPETSHVIPALIKKVLEDDIVDVYGTGSQIREFLYAEDAARGAMLLLEKYPYADPVNIGNPHNRVTIRALARLIMDIIYDDEAYKPLRFDTSMPDGYPQRGSNISRLVRATGWQPEVGLREGLARTIEWYQANKEIAERALIW